MLIRCSLIQRFNVSMKYEYSILSVGLVYVSHEFIEMRSIRCESILSFLPTPFDSNYFGKNCFLWMIKRESMRPPPNQLPKIFDFWNRLARAIEHQKLSMNPNFYHFWMNR